MGNYRLISKSIGQDFAQYNKNGEFITVYESARIAEQALHLPNKSGQHILDCARGKLKTAYGFIWKLAS